LLEYIHCLIDTIMILPIVQAIAAILLIILILVQNRGTGLGSAFGGGDNVYRTKRGLEKNIFVTTIVLAVIFLATALLSAFYPL
jgi:preprotein translocase subunit SecG